MNVRDFVSRNKSTVVAVMSIAIGLAWTYLWWNVGVITESSNATGVLIFIGIFIGIVFAEDVKERIVLICISVFCSVGTQWLIFLILFFIATGRFLEYYRYYPW